MKPRWLRINLAEIALLLVLGFALFQFSRFAFQIISFPYPVDYGEGPLLGQVGRLADFEPLYRADLTHAPFTITNYPPLYLLLQAPLNWIFGPALWYGRLLSLLGILAAALFLALTLRGMTGDGLAALSAGLLLLAIPYVRAWAPLFRVDGLALGLSWAALYLLVRRPAGRHSLLAAAILLTAAIYTRQSYGLAAPLAAFTWLLSQRPHRRAFQLAAWVAGCAGGVFLLLNLLTKGGFAFNIITANVNKFQPETLMYYVQRVSTDLPLLLASAGLFLLFGWIRNRTWSLAGPYLLGAVLSALTIGKIGSNVNYLLELSASLCLVMGLALAWLRGKRFQADGTPARVAWQLASLGLTLILAAQVGWAVQREGGYDRTLLAKTSLRAQNERLVSLIEASEGPVLTGDHMALLALLDRPVYYQPFEMKQLSDSGVWDQTPFLEELAGGKYPLILMNPMGSRVVERRWTPEMLAIIAGHYRQVDQIDNTVVYEWRE